MGVDPGGRVERRVAVHDLAIHSGLVGRQVPHLGFVPVADVTERPLAEQKVLLEGLSSQASTSYSSNIR